jgi:hypothetical protein
VSPSGEPSGRIASAADDLEEANRELLAFLGSLTDEQWRAAHTRDGWTLAAAAYHVADGYRIHMGWLDLVRRNQPVPGVPEDLDALNARTVADASELTPRDVLIATQTAGRLLVAYVRDLEPSELAASASHGPLARPEVSVDFLLDITAWHVRDHLRGMREAVRSPREGRVR